MTEDRNTATTPGGPYGHFTEDGMAYRITDPATPRAFDNFLWNDTVMSGVHQTGVGTCDIQVDGSEAIQVFTGVGRICDIEAYGRDHLMSRLVYIRDNETGIFWNLGWEPVCHRFDSYCCEHGFGYTHITSETEGIHASMLLLVPPGDAPVEQWKLQLENRSDRTRSLSVFVYNQYTLSYMWGFESYGDMLYRGAWFEASCNGMIVQKHPYIAPHEHLTAFLVADRPVDGHDGSRRAFVGDYATLATPRAVVSGQCTNTPGSSEATIAALQFNMELDAGSSETFELLNGVADSVEQVGVLARQHLGKTEAALDSLRQEKRDLVATNSVTTPDPHFNRIVNGWLKQQALFGATWCRWGYMGYRDIVQHGYGVSSFAPERTRQIVIDACKHMNRNGVALRGWNPVDTKPYSDSTLWLVYTLTAYLRETGNFELLDYAAPFYDQGEATVLEHVETALQFLERNKGSHGLCLIKFGDWNDSLTNIGKEGRGESVWLSMAYAYALGEMRELYAFMGRRGKADAAQRRREVMLEAIRSSAWDGQWFVRCFDDRGQPVGSHTNSEGSIFLNAQSWALISGAADDTQRTTLLSACRDQLLTDVGYRLLAPPYLTRDDHIGRISYLEPGICENGTVYSHGNAFMFFAQLAAGLGDEAYETFRRLTPGYTMGPDCPKQQCPPYVYPNGHYAPEHRNSPLQAEFTWITGSIAWWLNGVIDKMIGVRREFNGLTLAPILPSEWDEIRMTRRFRARTFDVHIRRGAPKQIVLNGHPIEENFINLDDCEDHNNIEVIL